MSEPYEGWNDTEWRYANRPPQSRIRTGKTVLSPRCEAVGCGHLAHFAVRTEDGELSDVCMVHFLAVVDGIRESDE